MRLAVSLAVLPFALALIVRVTAGPEATQLAVVVLCSAALGAVLMHHWHEDRRRREYEARMFRR